MPQHNEEFISLHSDIRSVGSIATSHAYGLSAYQISQAYRERFIRDRRQTVR
jgi:hypothetical protein